MRTTVRLPDELYGEVRRRSLEQGRTVTSFIEQALRAALNENSSPAEQFQVQPFAGNGTRPGIDLDDSAGLLDMMEG
jgi:hypothetical protein